MLPFISAPFLHLLPSSSALLASDKPDSSNSHISKLLVVSNDFRLAASLPPCSPFYTVAMSSAEEGSLHGGRPRPTRAIAIPGADLDSDLDDVSSTASSPRDASTSTSQWYAASPGAHSYVAGNESWRPVPPPMLASSIEKRFQPHFHTQTAQERSQAASQARQRAPLIPPSSSTAGPAASGSPGTSRSGRPSSQYGALEILTPGEPEAVGAASAAVPMLPVPGLQTRKPRASRSRPPRHPDSEVPVAPRTATVHEKLAKLMAQVRMLNEAPRELWLIFALKFLSSYAYFSLSLVLTMFLTDEFGMSDTAAGWAYGAYGVMSTLFGLLCGWFIDYLGVRASLLIGALIGAFSRFVMALTLSKKTAVLMLYTFLPFAECLGIPIMTIGIKRYTNARNRTFAFSLFYSMMNVAALCAGPLVDLSRTFFGDGITLRLDPLGHDIRFTGLRLIILSSAFATAAMCLVVLIGIREIHVDETGNLAEFTPNRESPLEQTLAVLREPAFWRLTVFTLLLVGVRLVFRHLDATMPKYLVRQFGPSAPFGLVYAINPFLIIFLVPVIGLLTRKIDSFSMILAGSFVSAVSPFWLCVKQSYASVVLFMATLSIGEAVYSPRVYEYTMEVSADGSEGLYSSLSTAPLFSVKLLVGGMSGWLLTSFMPADGPHHGNILWGIIGLTSLTSPILMCLLREYISPSSERGTRPGTVSELSEGSVGSKLLAHEDRPSAARPPTGRSTAIPINLSDYDDEESEYDTTSAASPSSHHGNSPASLPPQRMGSSNTSYGSKKLLRSHSLPQFHENER